MDQFFISPSELLWAVEDSGIFDGTFDDATLHKEHHDTYHTGTAINGEYLADGDFIIISSSESSSSSFLSEVGYVSVGECGNDFENWSDSDGSVGSSAGEIHDEYNDVTCAPHKTELGDLYCSDVEDSSLVDFKKTEDLFSNFDSCSDVSDCFVRNVNSCHSLDEVYNHSQNSLLTWSLTDLVQRKGRNVMRSHGYFNSQENLTASSYQDELWASEDEDFFEVKRDNYHSSRSESPSDESLDLSLENSPDHYLEFTNSTESPQQSSLMSGIILRSHSCPMLNYLHISNIASDSRYQDTTLSELCSNPETRPTTKVGRDPCIPFEYLLDIFR